MARFTRLTVVGSIRRADVVVPSDEGVGVLLADLLDLLGEDPETVPQDVSLVRLTGDQVDLTMDAAEQGLADGEVLRVVRTSEAPPPPDVADVTDATAERLAARTDRWSPGTRRMLAAVVAGVATTVVTLAGWASWGSTPGLVVSGVLVLVATAAAVGAARTGHRHTARTLLAVGLGAAPLLGVTAMDLLGNAGLVPSGPGRSGAVLLATRLAVTAAWLVLAVGGGALRLRGSVAGGVLGALLAAGSAVVQLLLPAVAGDAVTAITSVLVTGLLPWWAMTAAGLTGLDDTVADTGHAPPRARVHATVDDAFAGLGWSAVAVALPLSVAATGLLAAGNTLAVLLGVAVVLVTALRTRSLPLRGPALTLWAAALVPPVIAAVGLVGTAPVAVAAVTATVGALVALTAGLDPSGQQRARLRRLGDRLELVGVLVLLPLALGVFGVYRALLGVF